MNTDFRIQDPGYLESSYLLEDLLDACGSATRGGGTYAFASPGGIRLLIADKAFQTFLGASTFELVVGVDAVTNAPALQLLGTLMRQMPGLSVKVLVDTDSSTLFHPKFAWFANEERATWFIGSSNLTAGGLRGNVEAYTIQHLSLHDHEIFEVKWRQWLEFRHEDLYAFNDQKAIDRAKQNSGREIADRNVKGLVQELLAENPEGLITVNALHSPSNAVLIAEIPGNTNNRWKQANFSLQVFTNFFGATPGRTQRILLTHIKSNGTAEEEEIRPSIAVKSQNYRFELNAASGLAYPPPPNKPICVFLRAGTRTFRYHLLMPGDAKYSLINNFLHHRTTVKENQIRRYETDVLTLASVWPDCPVLK